MDRKRADAMSMKRLKNCPKLSKLSPMAQDRMKTIYDKYQLTEKSVEHGVELDFDEELSNWRMRSW